MLRIYEEAEGIARASVDTDGLRPRPAWDQRLDRLLTHRVVGFLVMGALFYLVFWFTIAGAALPSELLFQLLVDHGHPAIRSVFEGVGSPAWLTGVLVDGVYLGVAWVVAVMLPPMAIFFPLFTLLEDLGYLPRVAFNLDRLFGSTGAHGKQALTMMMGFGCNAAGVTSTRIIDSPRERLIAIITNNFSVCNGRWPTLILMSTIFLGTLVPAPLAGAVAAASVVLVACLGIVVSFLVASVLSRSVLRGETSIYTLELPPYRRPQVWRTIYTSVVDRTLKVLTRALVMAAPAGAVIWLISNVRIGEDSLAGHLAAAMDPIGMMMGLNGIILLAYLVAIPANEIIIPTILMLTVSLGEGPQTHAGVLLDLATAQAGDVLVHTGGWTVLTAVNLMLFTLLHHPCSTTVLTIWKETGSPRWTVVATVLPLALGLLVTVGTTAVARLVGS
ncbi:nucleoside recognition domain-containing protein [Nocardioides pyridinolyticus]